MKVLVACEFSGIVRDAFSARGHDAWSCDLLPTESEQTKKEGKHIQGDVLEILNNNWDMMIAHPPCTYLTNSGARWLFEKEKRWQQLIDGLGFFQDLQRANIPLKAIENPWPHKWALRILRRPNQKIQPYQFGEKAKKGICFWLYGLPPLLPTKIIEPPKSGSKEAKEWEKVWREPPGPNQAKNRSRFFPGIANAMAEQWSEDLTNG